MATPKPGSIVHIELHSPAPEKTQRFYESVFGWKFEAMPQMNYAMFKAPSGLGGGLMSPMEGMGPMVLNYILSTDIDETVRNIQSAGGAVVVPKSEIPNMGWFAVFKDPAGVVQGLYEAMAAPRAAPARKAKRSSGGARAKKSSTKRRR